MSEVAEQHRATSPQHLGCAVITVSDTRTLDTDTGGALIVELLAAAGHALRAREIVADEPAELERLLVRLGTEQAIDAILLSGGTGISSRDRTIETVEKLLTRPLPGYGELLRMLSYQQVGAAAMLSRATGGLMGRQVVLTMPGSPAGVRLAMDLLILPELGHLVREARR